MTDREVVRFKGVLANEQVQVNCEGTAEKVTARQGSGFPIAIGFARIRIEKMSEPLADGLYTLTGPGQQRMRLRNGIWEEVR